MNAYITLDGNKYATSAPNWKKVTDRPNTVRYTLAGALDITFSDATPIQWVGEIVADVTSRGTGWGTYTTLIASLVKKTALVLTDHYGSAYNVYSVAPLDPRSLSSKWDDANNTFLVPVTLIYSSVYTP